MYTDSKTATPMYFSEFVSFFPMAVRNSKILTAIANNPYDLLHKN